MVAGATSRRSGSRPRGVRAAGFARAIAGGDVTLDRGDRPRRALPRSAPSRDRALDGALHRDASLRANGRLPGVRPRAPEGARTRSAPGRGTLATLAGVRGDAHLAVAPLTRWKTPTVRTPGADSIPRRELALICVDRDHTGRTGAQPRITPAAPTMLTVDDAAAPLAVEGEPQFGWVVNDPDRGEVQTAYESGVEEPQIDGGAGRTVWDSGEVRSGSRRMSPRAAGARSRPYLLVAAFARGIASSRVGPSPPRTFDAGLPRRRLGCELDSASRSRAGARRLLAVAEGGDDRARPGRPRRAYMSAGQQYDLRVNGVRVAHGPVVRVPRRAVLRGDRYHERARAGPAT